MSHHVHIHTTDRTTDLLISSNVHYVYLGGNKYINRILDKIMHTFAHFLHPNFEQKVCSRTNTAVSRYRCYIVEITVRC